MLRSVQYVAAIFPIIFCLGIVANITVVALMLRKSLRKSTTGLYLACLAVTDSLILITGCFTRWMYYTFDLSFGSISEIACKLSGYLPICLELLEAWLLVSIGLERLVAVKKPHSLNVWFSRKRAGFGIGVTAAACFILPLSVWQFVSLEVNPEVGIVCTFKTGKAGLATILVISMAILSWIIPYIIIIACNIGIIKKMKRTYAAVAGTTNTEEKGRLEQRSITRIILATTFTSISLTTPRFVYRSLMERIKIDRFTASDDVLWWIYIVAQSLHYMNSAVNIVFYIAPGTNFRKELLLMVNCCGKTKVHPAQNVQAANA